MDQKLEEKDYEKVYKEIVDSVEELEIPDCLQPESIKKMIKKSKQQKSGHRKWEWAAAIVLVAVGVTAMGVHRLSMPQLQLQPSIENTQTLENPVVDVVEAEEEFVRLDQVGEYHLATSYEEYVSAFLAQSQERYYLFDKESLGPVEEFSNESDDSLSMSGAVADLEMADSTQKQFSATNVQVAGVDESDFVKNDGEFLYIQDDRKVHVIDVRGDQMEELTVFEPNLKENFRIEEIYLDDHKLYLIAQEWEESLEQVSDDMAKVEVDCIYPYYFNQETNMILLTYDISDRREIRLLGRIEQDGAYFDSRKVGEYIYLLSRKDTYLYEPLTDDEARTAEADHSAMIPCVNGEQVAMDSIYLRDGASTQLVISSVNVEAPGKSVDQIVLLDSYASLYMSKNAIYLYEYDYEWNEESSETKSYTKITKFSYQDGKMNGVGATRIRGTINDVFAISEANGVLRVLTTDWMGQETHNQLYLLDEKLEKLGELVDFASGEEIYAARYIGDIAYFITYHNTDPLFAVDISNPKKPTILGQIEISGFSDYLHAFGENELLGIGYETDPQTSERLGVKLVMFDLTDPTDLKVKASVVLEGTYSSATDVYKAVFVDTDRNLIGLDVSDWRGQKLQTTYHMYQWDGQKFQEKMTQDMEECWNQSMTRGLYAGEYFYLVYQRGEELQLEQFGMTEEFPSVASLELTSK